MCRLLALHTLIAKSIMDKKDVWWCSKAHVYKDWDVVIAQLMDAIDVRDADAANSRSSMSCTKTPQS